MSKAEKPLANTPQDATEATHTITIRDLHKTTGASLSTIRGRIRTLGLEASGHVVTRGDTKYLDQHAASAIAATIKKKPTASAQATDNTEALAALREQLAWARKTADDATRRAEKAEEDRRKMEQTIKERDRRIADLEKQIAALEVAAAEYRGAMRVALSTTQAENTKLRGAIESVVEARFLKRCLGFPELEELLLPAPESAQVVEAVTIDEDDES